MAAVWHIQFDFRESSNPLNRVDAVAAGPGFREHCRSWLSRCWKNGSAMVRQASASVAAKFAATQAAFSARHLALLAHSLFIYAAGPEVGAEGNRPRSLAISILRNHASVSHDRKVGGEGSGFSRFTLLAVAKESQLPADSSLAFLSALLTPRIYGGGESNWPAVRRLFPFGSHFMSHEFRHLIE
jgi:hypothetical protein